MKYINLFGLAVVLLLLVPNVIFMLKHGEGFENKWSNRAVEILEQIGRFGCFISLSIRTGFWGFSSVADLFVYVIVDSLLLASYLVIWAILWKKPGIPRALLLSIIPSALFIFSAAISHEYVFLSFSLIFAPCHILISYKNAS